jgi:hypothetical protein
MYFIAGQRLVTSPLPGDNRGKLDEILGRDAVEAALIQTTFDQDCRGLIKGRVAIGGIYEDVGVEKGCGHPNSIFIFV